MKLNCSRPPFAASVRHCLGLLSSSLSLSLFSSQAVLSKSPFGCVKVCVCVCGSKVPFSQSFLMPIGRELPRFRVCGAVWQLQFIQTWAWGDKGEKSHYKASDFHLDRGIDPPFPPLCLTVSNLIPPGASNILGPSPSSSVTCLSGPHF